VDEEHRFGVKHKERLKQLKLETDVLTLTATPIPAHAAPVARRLRDMTIMATPPTRPVARCSRSSSLGRRA
jgi:transcription-repair coupling factor (superfamily II helicase)